MFVTPTFILAEHKKVVGGRCRRQKSTPTAPSTDWEYWDIFCLEKGEIHPRAMASQGYRIYNQNSRSPFSTLNGGKGYRYARQCITQSVNKIPQQHFEGFVLRSGLAEHILAKRDHSVGADDQVGRAPFSLQPLFHLQHLLQSCLHHELGETIKTLWVQVLFEQ